MRYSVRNAVNKRLKDPFLGFTITEVEDTFFGNVTSET